MPRSISSASSLDNLRKEARRWLRALRANDAAARARFDRACRAPVAQPVLRDVQHALARDYGYESWLALKTAVASARGEDRDSPRRTADDYERLARDFVLAFDAQDREALDRLTNAGLASLARLPHLREVSLDGLPGVTLEGTRVFPRAVRVRYST